MSILTITGLFSLFCNMAHADGLTDLKAALAHLRGQTPLKAAVEVKTWRRSGEGKDADENSGQAGITLEDGTHGLQLIYGKEILARAESEQWGKAKNPEAKTPTVDALRDLNSTELLSMVSASGALSHKLEEAKFKSEKAEIYDGKPARLLNFEFSIDRLAERDRKYVKKYAGVLEIWIAADGTPLASRFHENISGRAFVVVGFDMENIEDCVYALNGDRLVAVRKESKSDSSGAGEKGQSKTTKTLQLQS